MVHDRGRGACSIVQLDTLGNDMTSTLRRVFYSTCIDSPVPSIVTSSERNVNVWWRSRHTKLILRQSYFIKNSLDTLSTAFLTFLPGLFEIDRNVTFLILNEHWNRNVCNDHIRCDQRVFSTARKGILILCQGVASGSVHVVSQVLSSNRHLTYWNWRNT